MSRLFIALALKRNPFQKVHTNRCGYCVAIGLSYTRKTSEKLNVARLQGCKVKQVLQPFGESHTDTLQPFNFATLQPCSKGAKSMQKPEEKPRKSLTVLWRHPNDLRQRLGSRFYHRYMRRFHRRWLKQKEARK